MLPQTPTRCHRLRSGELRLGLRQQGSACGAALWHGLSRALIQKRQIASAAPTSSKTGQIWCTQHPDVGPLFSRNRRCV
jgi:hypothetical protein